jgi:hypothetical protein
MLLGSAKMAIARWVDVVDLLMMKTLVSLLVVVLGQ